MTNELFAVYADRFADEYLFTAPLSILSRLLSLHEAAEQRIVRGGLVEVRCSDKPNALDLRVVYVAKVVLS